LAALSGDYNHLLALPILSNASGTTALIRFLFQGCDHFVETLDIGSANATDNGAF